MGRMPACAKTSRDPWVVFQVASNEHCWQSKAFAATSCWYMGYRALVAHVWAGEEEEWRDWSEVGDPIMHIELRRWADCLVVAPLSANTLAKLAQGLCDNLLTCVVGLPLSSDGRTVAASLV